MGPSSFLSSQGGPPTIELSSSTMRVVTDPKMSAAAAALNSISKGENWRMKQEDKGEGKGKVGGRARGESYPDPPLPEVVSVPSAPEVRPPSVKDASISTPNGLETEQKAHLELYTYTIVDNPVLQPQPSPLPRQQSFSQTVTSLVKFNYKSLPWRIRNGDYLELRRTDAEAAKQTLKTSKGGESDRAKIGGEALKGVSRRYERDGYIFRVGADSTDTVIGQIQVPESVATAFRFQHRMEVDIYIVRIKPRLG